MLMIQLMIVQVLTFLALVFALRKIMYSASFFETKRLQKLNEENAKKAQELETKIEEAEALYKERSSNAEEEVRKLKIAAKEELEKLREQVLNQAKKEAEHLVSQALSTKDKIKEEVTEQMMEKCTERSIKLIQSVLNSDNEKLVHEGLVQEAIDQIEDIKEDTIKVATSAKEVEVRLPYNLSHTQRERLEKLLSSKIGHSIALEEILDKEAIAGMILKLGSLVIDGSLSGRLKEAAKNL